MTANRRFAPFAAALIIALFVAVAHFAARPTAAAPASASPAPVAVPAAPAPVFNQSAAPAAQPVFIGAAPVAVPEPALTAHTSVTSVTTSAARFSGQPPAFVLLLSSFVLLAFSLTLARRPVSHRRPICA